MSKQTKADAEATAAEEAAEQAFLIKQVGPEEQRENVYEYRMSSTETALTTESHFWEIKLTG